jgi:hypothetical protein
VLLDSELNVKGTWANQDTAYGYDFWYQPAHNIMVSSEFGTPLEFFKGFNPAGEAAAAAARIKLRSLICCAMGAACSLWLLHSLPNAVAAC